MTGVGISYDPLLIEHKVVYCVREAAEEEEVLGCILSRPELDFIRLSSGTYVVVEPNDRAPRRGSIAGIVRDLETGAPLPNAHVLLASAGSQIGTVTNSHGQFTLPPLLPGAYFVNTTYLGYHDHLDTLYVRPGEHAFQRIELQESPIMFTPLVIDGLQRKRPSETLDESLLFNKDALETGNYLQRTAVLQQSAAVPGVRVNDLTADTHLQGSDAGEHQFRLDGIPIFLPQSAIGLIGPFSPFAIESISIHQAGFGVEQGSNLAGVVSARHKLQGERRMDIQVDPMSFNARVGNRVDFSEGKSLSGMTTVRSSLWRIYQQPAFQKTLDAWSKPDPFLIFGPSRQYTEIAPSFFQDILNISAIPNTDMNFLDLHAAGSYAFSALSGLSASFYLGKNKFGGSLLPSFLAGVGFRGDDATEGARVQDIFPAPLSLVDEYAWNNVAGQITYHTLLGNHTLMNVQAKASSYTLDQNYRIIDSLEQFIQPIELPENSDFSASNLTFNVPTVEIQDINDIDAYTLEAQIEHARSGHLISAGLEGSFAASRFDLLVPSLTPLITATIDTTTLSTVDLERINYSNDTGRLAAFLQDRILLGNNASLEAGIRITYLPIRKTIYGEPRISFRIDRSLPKRGSIAFQTAAGLYRQFLLQFDISTLNAGALFPSKRVWLPVDASIRPPLAYHLSQSVLISPSEAWTIRASGYLKFYWRSWTINYVTRSDASGATGLTNSNSAQSREFLSPVRGLTSGASFYVSRQVEHLQTAISYEFSAIQRKSEDLFDNRRTAAPWEEPHRLSVDLQWRPHQNFLTSARFSGIWGRSWGFRKAYYDFFGHSEETRFQPPYDFASPDDHKLPPHYQLDLSAAYSRSFDGFMVQLRFDLLNALNNDNVVDWRLIWQEEQLVKDERLLYPRIPSLALRVGW